MSNTDPRIAVLVPCCNEAATIVQVIRDFRRHLPGATVYMYDNNSRDETMALARREHAVVRSQPMQGKGHVVRRMFADIDADVYVLVDGDDTYDASAAPAMLQRLAGEHLDMVVGARGDSEDAAYRAGHRLGNRMLTGFVGLLFGRRITDMLSGYRVMSRRFVKSFPAQSSGFETETELSVHALELRMPMAEHVARYRSRPHGSSSKLSTWRDGLRILATIFTLFKDARPLAFFSIACAVTAIVSVALAVPLVDTWLQTGQVPRFPTAILCAALMVMAAVFLVCGLVLDTVTRGRLELRHLAYLAIPPVAPPAVADARAARPPPTDVVRP